MGKQTFSQGENPLLRSNAASLQHDEILFHLPVVRESTHGCNSLISQIIICGSVILYELAILHVISSTHPVDLLIDLSSVVVSLLTSSWYGELDPARMPSSNTGNLSQTLVSLPWQFLCVPPAGYALEPVTFGHSNDVNHFVLSKDSANRNFLLEVIPSKVDLISNGSAIQLNLHDMSLLLPASEDLHLSVHDHSDCSAILFHLIQILFNHLLAKIISPLSAGLSEGFLLGLRPVLIKPSLAFLADVLSPDGLQSSKTSWSFDVSNDSNGYHWRSFYDGNCFNNFLLVNL